MTPKEAAQWTTDSVRAWARDLFASRDEAARIAHEETIEQRDALRREFDKEIIRINERLLKLDRETEQRLQEERDFRDKVVEQALTREQYQREHKALEDKLDIDVQSLDKRITRNENLLANLTGKAVVFAVLGSIFLATVTAFITHLLSG